MPAQAKQPSFALAAGQLFEKLGDWAKAEDEYLKAGEDVAPTLQQETLDALARVRRAARTEKRRTALLVAKSLESQGRWKDAEQAYLEMLKSDPAAEKDVVGALERLRPRVPGERWTEAFDEIAGTVGRGLVVLTIILVLWIGIRETKKTRRSIQFLPFRASSDDGAKRMAFWIGRVHAELKSPAMPVPLAPGLVSGLPFVRMPDLPEQVNETAEFEVGGVKFPLMQLTRLVSIPRIRVSCGWNVGSVAGDATAEVEYRQRTKFATHSAIARSVVSILGDAQDKDLRLFGYDVFIRIGNAYGRK